MPHVSIVVATSEDKGKFGHKIMDNKGSVYYLNPDKIHWAKYFVIGQSIGIDFDWEAYDYQGKPAKKKVIVGVGAITKQSVDTSVDTPCDPEEHYQPAKPATGLKTGGKQEDYDRLNALTNSVTMALALSTAFNHETTALTQTEIEGLLERYQMRQYERFMRIHNG